MQLYFATTYVSICRLLLNIIIHIMFSNSFVELKKKRTLFYFKLLRGCIRTISLLCASSPYLKSWVIVLY